MGETPNHESEGQASTIQTRPPSVTVSPMADRRVEARRPSGPVGGAPERGERGEERRREALARALPVISALLESLSPLWDYQLAVPRGDHAELWVGLRRSPRPLLSLAAPAAEPGAVWLQERLHKQRETALALSPELEAWFGAESLPRPGC